MFFVWRKSRIQFYILRQEWKILSKYIHIQGPYPHLRNKLVNINLKGHFFQKMRSKRTAVRHKINSWKIILVFLETVSYKWLSAMCSNSEGWWFTLWYLCTLTLNQIKISHSMWHFKKIISWFFFCHLSSSSLSLLITAGCLSFIKTDDRKLS